MPLKYGVCEKKKLLVSAKGLWQLSGTMMLLDIALLSGAETETERASSWQ